MAYRNDLEAAHHRIHELEADNARFYSEPKWSTTWPPRWGFLATTFFKRAFTPTILIFIVLGGVILGSIGVCYLHHDWPFLPRSDTQSQEDRARPDSDTTSGCRVCHSEQHSWWTCEQTQDNSGRVLCRRGTVRMCISGGPGLCMDRPGSTCLAWTCMAKEHPVPEIRDGLDNDCDGEADEVWSGPEPCLGAGCVFSRPEDTYRRGW